MNSWGLIKFIAFLGLFISILTCFWAYSYSTIENEVYPYRSSVFAIIIVIVALFILYFYAGVRAGESKAFNKIDDTKNQLFK